MMNIRPGFRMPVPNSTPKSGDRAGKASADATPANPKAMITRLVPKLSISEPA